MAKFFGPVGYMTTYEDTPGVWKEKLTEREYFGDVLQNSKRFDGSSNQNDNLDINLRISIVADPFAYSNFHTIRYVTYMGTDWKVSSVEPQYPRLILTIGGVYNGRKQT